MARSLVDSGAYPAFCSEHCTAKTIGCQNEFFPVQTVEGLFTTVLDLVATQLRFMQYNATGLHCSSTQKSVVSSQRRSSTPWHDRDPSAERRGIVVGRHEARCSSHLEHITNRCFPTLSSTASLRTVKISPA